MKTLRGIIINSAWVAVVAYGLHADNQLCLNLTKFTIWFMFVTMLLVQFLSKKDQANAFGYRPGQLQIWVSAMTDISVTLILAANGWFGYATLCAIQGACCAATLDKASKEAK